MIPNIVFIGKSGAGKTTAAKVLRERFPDLGFETISFATPLKVGLGTNDDRHRLQEFGTDIVRAYDPQFWVRLFLWHLDLRSQVRAPAPAGGITGVRWCNDDCRFPNEIETLRDAGWIVVRVLAPRHVRLDRLRLNGRLTDEAQLEHSSETQLDGIEADHMILNDGDEGRLAYRIQLVVEDAAARA